MPYRFQKGRSRALSGYANDAILCIVIFHIYLLAAPGLRCSTQNFDLHCFMPGLFFFFNPIVACGIFFLLVAAFKVLAVACEI